MNGTHIIALVLLFFCFSLSAQDTTYYDMKGYIPEDADARYMYEVNNVANGPFKRYYLESHVVAMEGVRIEGSMSGPVRRYYENGQLQSECTYVDGEISGGISRWYEHGAKLGDFYQMTYDEINTNEYDQSEKVLDLYDSAGNHLVKGGNGDGFEINGKHEVIGRGPFLHGLKNGLWEGERSEYLSYIRYSESYDKGQLVSGNSTDSLGNVYTYDELIVSAEFPGGMDKFYRYLANELRYPGKAQRNGVQGRVFVQFVVEKDGSLSNIKVVKGIGSGCDEEALRVVHKSKDWIPGKHRGQIARSKLVMNILFKFTD